MTEFIPLSRALKGRFNKKLIDLPDELRRRIQDDPWNSVLHWDSLSLGHRRARAKDLDSKNDPALEGERDRTWELAVELVELEAELEPKIRRRNELRAELSAATNRRRRDAALARNVHKAVKEALQSGAVQIPKTYGAT